RKFKVVSNIGCRAGCSRSNKKVANQQTEKIAATWKTGLWSHNSLRTRLSRPPLARQRSQSDHHFRPRCGLESESAPPPSKATPLTSRRANIRQPSQRSTGE